MLLTGALAARATVVTGVVTEQGSGAAVSGATVTMTLDDKTYTAESSGDGSYSLQFPYSAHSGTLKVESDYHYALTSSFMASQDGTFTRDYSLKPFGTSREFSFTLNVTNPSGQSLEGVSYALHCDRFDIDYSSSETTLDASGTSRLNVYPGRHSFTLSVPGMKQVRGSVLVNENKTINVTLEENIEAPYALNAVQRHNAYDGTNSVLLDWNSELALFSDDFESYSPFTTDPRPWTGLDLDGQTAAPIQGSYPNRETMQYITIPNPWEVDPAWDVQYYYTMAPRSGRQYAAFVQPSAGSNNDWFITPRVTLDQKDNYLRFYMRTADATAGRLKVGITTEENPKASDFFTISEGNWLRPGYEEWEEVIIPLDEYAGETVRIGFHCTSEQGAVMTMLDDVFIGRITVAGKRAQRMPAKSPANPNETFIITLDGEKVGTTDGYTFTVENVGYGYHTIGVQSKVLTGVSEVTTANVYFDETRYAPVTLNATANNGLSTDGISIDITGKDDAKYNVALSGGTARLAALEKGEYTFAVDAPGYEKLSKTVNVSASVTVDLTLIEELVAPFNVTADLTNHSDGTFSALMQWNRDLGFRDSFEEYDDFATGTFGGWRTRNYNGEHQVSYPVSFGGYEVNFPGASTQSKPVSMPPMVFNPLRTSPSLQDDGAFLAPDGNKYVAFFGPQSAASDKWLCSPKIKIYDGYEFSFTAKAYPVYPETFEICVATEGTWPENFTVLDAVTCSYDQWTRYTVDLSEYAGREVYVGLHHVTYDGFVGQVDDVAVAPAEEAATHGSGFAQNYTVSLDGTALATTEETSYNLSHIADRDHTVGIKANFRTGTSQETTYLISRSGISDVPELTACLTTAPGQIIIEAEAPTDYTVTTPSALTVARGTASGTVAIPAAPGIYMVTLGTKTLKVTLR